MENQTGGISQEPRLQPFQQPAPGYPPPFPPVMPPGYPPAFQQAYPPQPMPMYPLMPAPDLPPSPFPLQMQTPRQQNVLAILSIVIGALAGVLNYVLYFFYYESVVVTTTRAQEVIVLRNSALLHILPLSIAIGAFVCAIVALTYARNHGWNGLVPALVGLVTSTYFLYSAASFIFEFAVSANVLQNLVP